MIESVEKNVCLTAISIKVFMALTIFSPALSLRRRSLNFNLLETCDWLSWIFVWSIDWLAPFHNILINGIVVEYFHVSHSYHKCWFMMKRCLSADWTIESFKVFLVDSSFDWWKRDNINLKERMISNMIGDPQEKN